MANWNLPGLTDLYSNVLQYLKDRDTDLSRWFSTKFTAATNVADGTIRWNDTNKNWEIWNATSSTWGLLSSKFMIDVDTTDGYHAGTGANNLLVLDASGLVGVANLPTTMTGKSADMVDGAHAQVAAAASVIPIRDASGNVVGNITGNAAYATSAGNADTVDGAHAQVAAAAGTIPIRDASGNVAGNITGNAVTATTASSCSGNAATATTAASCTGNAATATSATSATNATNATNATYGRYVWNNTAYGGSSGYVEPSAMYVAYAASAGNASTVGGENVTTLAQHRTEGRNYIDNARFVYDNGAYSGSAGWKEPSAASKCAGCSWTCTSACTGACSSTCTGGCSSCVGACNGACTSCTNSCTSCTNNCYTTCSATCQGVCGGCDGGCATSG